MFKASLIPIYALILCAFLFSNKSSAANLHENVSKPSILFIYPSDKGFPFWDSQLDFASAVADAFDFNLEVAYVPFSYRNRFDITKYFKNKIEGMSRQPSLVISHFWLGSEQEILTLLNEKRIPLISINSELTEKQFVQLGRPREKFDLWLAHFSPDDTFAGEQLAQAVVAQSRKLRCESTACKVNVFAITGVSYTAVSKQRARGLQSAIRKDKNANLLSILYGKWDRQLIESKAASILKRHDDIHAFWFAGDILAYGFLDGINSAQLKLNENSVIGGIDWSPATIGKIKKGEMHVSFGGHFMEAGWGLILFYDHLHGLDLPRNSTTVFKTQMSLLNKQNINELGPFLDSPKWSRERLRSYSRYLNPSRAEYNLNPRKIILEHLDSSNKTLK